MTDVFSPLRIGSSTDSSAGEITRMMVGTVTADPASMADEATADVALSVPGVGADMFAVVTINTKSADIAAGVQSAVCTANTITVTLFSAQAAGDLIESTFAYIAFK